MSLLLQLAAVLRDLDSQSVEHHYVNAFSEPVLIVPIFVRVLYGELARDQSLSLLITTCID